MPSTNGTQVVPTYQVGAFALVRRQSDVLLVRPYQLLLPGGPQSLPGTLLDVHQSGMGVVEVLLRRLLLSQVGISVSEFWLVGSHTTRSSDAASIPRLNLIFGTEYCSGILNPQKAELKSALWIPQAQLTDRVPEWLRAALFEMSKVAPPVAAPANTGGAGLFARRR